MEMCSGSGPRLSSILRKRRNQHDMPRERLQRLLQELSTELSSDKDLAPDDIRSLRILVDDLRGVVDEQTDSDDDSVLADLRSARARFESSHPKLTEALATVSDLLRSIGIS